MADLLEFLNSLTDQTLPDNPALSNPWVPPVGNSASGTRYPLRGEVVRVFSEDGAVVLYHDAVSGLMSATKPPSTMEFVVDDRAQLEDLRPGDSITASVRRQGRDLVLFDIRQVSSRNGN
jgi:Cu/Ag efflux protein CusF